MPREYNSKGKNEVLLFLRNNKEHCLTAAEILEGLVKNGKNINRSTVYRNLEKLVESGDIISFKGNESESAVYRYSGEHRECREHLHLQCGICGKIFHIEENFADEFAKRLLKDYEVELDIAKTMLEGNCKACRKSR